ncbi:glycosyltransferase family 4 protein [Roseovarius pacificus]|uniref:glycosyltransferase family 4 protein n=1 Tax=Roseovarius pacificus TaxID=337701 RepID=UPI002E128E57
MSGGSRVIAIYADLLTDMGHDVTVVAQGRKKPGKLRRLKQFLKGHKPKVWPTTSHFDTMNARLHVVDGARPIGDADVPDADVVIATFWTTAQTVANLSDCKGRKFYFVQHHEVNNPLFADQAAATYRLPFRKIVVSGWLRDVMRETYSDDDAQLVPNAVDHRQFRFRARSKQDAPTISLMYSGKGFKALDTSLEALALVRHRLPDLRVLAFGTPTPLERLPLPDYVTYVQSPAQDEIPRLYAASDLYLFGSRSEGFGLPVLEAMACGCPVVATRTGCAPDVIEEGKTGYVVDVDDAEALADAMIKLLTADADTWQTMSRDAAKAVDGYSWEASARAFAGVLGA